MKKLIMVALIAIIASLETGCRDNGDHQKVIELTHELQQERKTNGTLKVTAILLGFGCMVVLIAGTAIGSKCKRDLNRKGGAP